MAALSVQSASGAKRGVRERGAQLGVGGDAADDGDRVQARSAPRPPPSLDERAHDRALVATRRGRPCAPRPRRRDRAPRTAAPSSRPRTRSRARPAARPGTRTPPGRPPARAGRSPRRRDSRGRAAARPCRTPRRPRRRSTCRARGSRVVAHVEQQRVAAAREQAEKRRLDADRARGRARRRGRADGRRARAAGRAPRRAPSPRRARRAARRSSPGPCVTATGSTSSRVAPASASASCDDGRDELEVPPRRDLGDDAAEARVQLGLRRDDVRADLALRGDERRGGLVAGRLDPEDHRRLGLLVGDRVPPHDQGVLAVVGVVAAADAAGDEAERS